MTTASTIAKRHDNSMAIAAMVLGTLSVTGFGLVLGIPAIILASISLKNKTGNRELSIAGLVAGIVGTALSLLFVCFILLALIFAADQPTSPQGDYPQDSTHEQQFESSKI